jgi:hypothetical protein
MAGIREIGVLGEIRAESLHRLVARGGDIDAFDAGTILLAAGEDDVKVRHGVPVRR